MNLQNIIKTYYMEHQQNLSDHVGITVEIYIKNGIKNTYKKRETLDKK